VRVAQVLGVAVSELVDVDTSVQMPSDLRIRKGLSQIELARATGLSTAVTGAFERAEVGWKDKYATKIAAVLEVSIEELREAWERARRRPPGTPA
jgi:transcriptional regulator with XRE-family HTH domain